MVLNKFTLIFPMLTSEHFHKDVGMIPFTLGKYYGFKPEILTYDNDDFSEFEVGHVRVTRVKKIFGVATFDFAFHLIKNHKKIDTLMLFHAVRFTFVMACIFKAFKWLTGSLSFVYVKTDDSGPHSLDLIFENRLIPQIVSKLFIDLYSSETKLSVNFLNKKKYINSAILIRNKNYFPCEYISNNNLKRENLLIHVTRVGAHQKNTDFFLKNIPFFLQKNPSWKVYIVGEIMENYHSVVKDFLKFNSELKERLQFLGRVTQRSEMAEIYLKAKIFASTSRWEGYSIALSEAQYFGLMIATTRVNGVDEMLSNYKLGRIYEQDDSIGFVNILNNFAKDSQDESLFQRNLSAGSSWSDELEPLNDYIRAYYAAS